MSRQNFHQQFGIALEQSVDGLGHLIGYPTDDPLLANVRLRLLIIRAANLDQALIEPCPFVVLQTNGLEDGQKKELKAGLSPTTVASYHKLLHLALDKAVEWSLVPRNV